MNWLAFDIGGANLKLADGQGFAASYSFAMWKDFQQLARELRSTIASAPRADHLAVTMTGELADCFETKTEGVQYILNAMTAAADGRHLRVYLSDGALVTPQVALQRPLMAASSNWHALARFAGRFAKRGPALLLDIGSTTTDLVPLLDGVPTPHGTNDTERLLSGELVYTGVERSPVCALVKHIAYRGQLCPVAQELFATTRDVYLMLGDLREAPDFHNTADGRPATKSASTKRLGRMISASGEQFSQADAVTMAEAVANAQLAMLTNAAEGVLQRMGGRLTTVVLSGHGDFLGRRVMSSLGLDAAVVVLRHELGDQATRCAPAHALAVLAREMNHP